MKTLPAGAVSYKTYLVLRDAAGAKVTGLTNTDVTALSYTRNGEAAVAFAAAAQTPAGAYTAGGFCEVSAANAPGLYRLDLPNGAFVAGVDDVTWTIAVTGTTGADETIAIDPSPANATGTVQAADAIGETTISLPAGLNVHEGTVGVVYAGTGVGSAFIIDSYATPSATTLKYGLVAALDTDSEVIFFAAPALAPVDVVQWDSENVLTPNTAGVPRTELVANGLNEVVTSEPAAVPAFGDGIVDAINWLLALARNELNQTAAASTLRNDADDADIATASVSDNGTTFVRGKWS